MVNKFKKWWFKITHVKCNYCNLPVEQYYDAWMFPIDTKEYKGSKICSCCIKKLKDQKNIIYTTSD